MAAIASRGVEPKIHSTDAVCRCGCCHFFFLLSCQRTARPPRGLSVVKEVDLRLWHSDPSPPIRQSLFSSCPAAGRPESGTRRPLTGGAPFAFSLIILGSLAVAYVASKKSPFPSPRHIQSLATTRRHTILPLFSHVWEISVTVSTSSRYPVIR